MAAQFPIVSVVLFIASGTLVFFLLFVFAKRQIVIFALRSSRKPHVNIGSDAPKDLRDKIQQCLEMTKEIHYDPTLLTEEIQNAANSSENHYCYRMKALDAFSHAVTSLRHDDASMPRRETKQTIQLYLYRLCPSAAGSKEAAILEKFALAYKQARHSPATFGETEFIKYMELLDMVIRLVKSDLKRRSQVIKSVDLEVQVKDGAMGTKTTTQTCKSENIPLETLPRNRKQGSPADVQAIREMSSGYSSTDRSNSDHGSAERLICTEVKRV